jgi:hypothetical protein
VGFEEASPKDTLQMMEEAKKAEVNNSKESEDEVKSFEREFEASSPVEIEVISPLPKDTRVKTNFEFFSVGSSSKKSVEATKLE